MRGHLNKYKTFVFIAAESVAMSTFFVSYKYNTVISYINSCSPNRICPFVCYICKRETLIRFAQFLNNKFIYKISYSDQKYLPENLLTSLLFLRLSLLYLRYTFAQFCTYRVKKQTLDIDYLDPEMSTSAKQIEEEFATSLDRIPRE